LKKKKKHHGRNDTRNENVIIDFEKGENNLNNK